MRLHSTSPHTCLRSIPWPQRQRAASRRVASFSYPRRRCVPLLLQSLCARVPSTPTLSRAGGRWTATNTSIMNNHRPMEILNWVRERNKKVRAEGWSDEELVESFVAIDDRALLQERGGDRLHGHFVMTHPYVTLSPPRVRPVRTGFGKPPPLEGRPRQKQNWFLKCLQGGRAHRLAACGVATLCCCVGPALLETDFFRCRRARGSASAHAVRIRCTAQLRSQRSA